MYRCTLTISVYSVSLLNEGVCGTILYMSTSIVRFILIILIGILLSGGSVFLYQVYIQQEPETRVVEIEGQKRK